MMIDGLKNHLENSIAYFEANKDTNIGLVHTSFCTSFESSKTDKNKFNQIDDQILKYVSPDKLRSKNLFYLIEKIF